ncbi:MAG: Icc-like protein [Desulfobacula sp.]|jgi:Icc-related predicted phosphoesterase|uniref:metallophosphoesterase family protein n=1 Tax=Desulfobacula sp. TaxID=2593537 RepID=UPI001D9D9D02|nr:Icc-like protein [Desulfobacula sp.]MBT3806859.1 Icc-like protein [Desulfobacula sp.]MBT6751522.1 Icc-like protein [Desulfobacula sp.]MBT7052053.1 Icc-like protein [Desulfobacula sp.]MBT7630543.1 Icc-like protein [Desulfobacula sp.]
MNNLKTPHKLKILTVSDFIDKSLTKMIEDKTLDPPDLIISCGDIEPEYLSFLRDRLDRPLFYIKGNHDIRYTSSNPVGCENIHGRVARFKSLNILGLEGSLWYNGGLNQYTDKEMKKIIFGMWFSIWRKGGIHMVVTHAPPRHIHDAEDRCHMGFESFIKLINKRKPENFIHGHIHKDFKTHAERVTNFNSTKVINTCGFTILEV